MSGIAIPAKEIQSLLDLITNNFYQQYQKTLDQSTLDVAFIPGRGDSRFGFQASKTDDQRYLKIRIYIVGFGGANTSVNFRLEQVQNNAPGYGDEVYVAETQLPVSVYPTLSKVTIPLIDNVFSPYAFELEDGSGYIQLESGAGFLEVEH